jgi:hypothetical protein
MKLVNYKVVDMPTELSRDVLMPDPNNLTGWVRDESWYHDIKEIYKSLLDFLVSNQLLRSKLEANIESLVIYYSDLNEIGQHLVKTGAIDRWMSSFDRTGVKKEFSDVRYLEKSLEAISSRDN